MGGEGELGREDGLLGEGDEQHRSSSGGRGKKGEEGGIEAEGRREFWSSRGNRFEDGGDFQEADWGGGSWCLGGMRECMHCTVYEKHP